MTYGSGGLWDYRNIAERLRDVLPGQLSDELHEIVRILQSNSVAVHNLT